MIQHILNSWEYKDGVVVWKRTPLSSKLKKGDPVPVVAKPSGHLVLSLWHEGKTTKLQYGRVVWLLVYGVWPEQEIDHIDLDPANNKVENLRLADRKQNNWNKHRAADYGVMRHGKTWRIRIQKAGKKYCVSRFNTKSEALEFRDLMVDEIFDVFKPTIAAA